MNTPQLLRRWWFYTIALVVAVAIVFTVFSSGDDADTTLKDFTDFASDGQVTSIQVSRDDRKIEYQLEGSEETYETRKEARVPLRELLLDASVTEEQIDRINMEFGATDSGLEWVGLLLNFLPIIVILAILFLFLRRGALRAKGVEIPYDPVCKTGVDSRRSAGTSTFQFVTYHFCSREHKADFDRDPPKYLLIDA